MATDWTAKLDSQQAQVSICHIGGFHCGQDSSRSLLRYDAV